MGRGRLRGVGRPVCPQHRCLRRRALTNRPGGGRGTRPPVRQPLRVAHRRCVRFGTVRLWTITADPTFGVPSWDENVVADVRSYDHLSPMVGLIVLLSAADTWRTAAFEAPHTTFRHRTPKPVRFALLTSCSGMRTRCATTCGTCSARPTIEPCRCPPPSSSVSSDRLHASNKWDSTPFRSERATFASVVCTST